MTGSRGNEAYDALGALYDVWCAEVEEDLPFYLGLAASLAGELGRDRLDVLELGAGSGRVSLALAAAGHRVTALELAGSQVERLRDGAATLDDPASLTVVQGDMRELAQLVVRASFDLVLAPFRGLLHVTAERDGILRAAHAALRPGGAFAFDVFHSTDEQVRATDGHWLHRRSQPVDGGRWSFDERARYGATDPATGERPLEVDVRATWSAKRRLGRGATSAAPTPDEVATVLALTLIPAAAWRASLEAAGFVVDGAYGWFDARPLDPAEDDDSIWVARRAD